MMLWLAFTPFLVYLHTFTLQHIHPVVLAYYLPSSLPVVTLCPRKTHNMRSTTLRRTLPATANAVYTIV